MSQSRGCWDEVRGLSTGTVFCSANQLDGPGQKLCRAGSAMETLGVRTVLTLCPKKDELQPAQYTLTNGL